MLRWKIHFAPQIVPKPVPTIAQRSLLVHSYLVQKMGANRVETEAACHAKPNIKCCSVIASVTLSTNLRFVPGIMLDGIRLDDDKWENR
jgi:hypothetical protein